MAGRPTALDDLGDPPRHTARALAAATYAVLRACRRKTAHDEAMARRKAKVVVAQDEEQRRAAYDPHDGVAQLIVSAKQHLDTWADLWPTVRSTA